MKRFLVLKPTRLNKFTFHFHSNRTAIILIKFHAIYIYKKIKKYNCYYLKKRKKRVVSRFDGGRDKLIKNEVPLILVVQNYE